MSSTSRPQTTGTSNIQPGQSPSKPSPVESTIPPQNVAQPLYQNNPNQQFIPNNIPLINQAQQLQFQSQLTNLQTAAFLQRQSQLLQQQQQQQHQHQQQQQQPNSVESQIKNQQLSNGPLGNFHNFPDLLNFFLFPNSNLNLPLPQLNQTPVQQQPLQTPKTVPVSPLKSGPLQHTPRSATTGSRSVSATTVNSAHTAELNSVTSATPSATVSEQNTEIPKQLTSPNKSSSVSTVSTPSSIISDRLVDEVKERTNALMQAIAKNLHDDTAMSNNSSPPNNMAQDIVSSPEVIKSTLPRKKQTAAGASPTKASPIISPSNTTGSHDSTTFSTPKKSEDVISVVSSPSTPSPNVSKIMAPTTTATITTTPTPPDKKAKQTKKEVNIQKSPKKNEIEPKKSSTVDDQKPATSSARAVPISSIPESVESDIKSKRNRFKTNLYQSPTPELVLATRMSVSEANKNSGGSKDKLIIFFTDEFIAVRNVEGTFFLCQCVHNIYRTSKKCRVRWLNDNSDDTYKLTFYDHVDKECILTSVSLENGKSNSYKLTVTERERIDNILKKSIDVEKGILPRPEVTEENPDGLDISLYKSESQIKTDDVAGHKRKSESSSKSVSPSKKIKTNAKTSIDPPPNRRKDSASSAVSTKKNKKSSKQLKKIKRENRSNVSKNAESESIGPKSSSKSEKLKASTSRSPDESNMKAGNKKAAKTKKQKKSTDTTSTTPSPERTLRKRSKN